MSVPEELSAAVDPGSVLLLGPSVESAVDDACLSLVDASDADALLVVTLSGTPSEWLDRWDREIGADRRPAEMVFVATGSGFGDQPELGPGITVETVSSPADLTGLGMIISETFQRWHEGDRAAALCFDSLTTLLQFEDLHNAYRFLNLVTTRLSAAGADSHFHLDPATVDDQTVSTLASTFRAVAEYEDGWTVRTR
jgi:hypothetical protein